MERLAGDSIGTLPRYRRMSGGESHEAGSPRFPRNSVGATVTPALTTCLAERYSRVPEWGSFGGIPEALTEWGWFPRVSATTVEL